MVNLEFSYNKNTYNSKIKLIEKIDLEKVNLKIDFLKSFDDEDYYEFEDFKNYEINTTIQYPVPVHKQEYYRKIVGDVSLQVTEQAVKKFLSLPMYPELSTQEIHTTVQALKNFHG